MAVMERTSSGVVRVVAPRPAPRVWDGGDAFPNKGAKILFPRRAVGEIKLAITRLLLQPRPGLRVSEQMLKSRKGPFVTPITQPPAAISPHHTAFFLDVDGTIADIVQIPQDARVSPQSLTILERLAAVSDGAVALISGRDITQLDKILHPLRLPAVGVHGLEWRLADGPITRLDFDAQAHDDLVQRINRFASAETGLHCEPKPGSVALHFRNRPDLEEVCQTFMHSQARADARLALLEGKMVVELIFGGQTKGDAVARLMEQPPFAGRSPFFAGDDVTDEAAFRHVNALGGVSIKIGAGPSSAQYRLSSPDALIDYLAGIMDEPEDPEQ